MINTFTINKKNLEELAYWSKMANFSSYDESKFAILKIGENFFDIYTQTDNNKQFYQRIPVTLSSNHSEHLPQAVEVDAKSLYALLKKIEKDDNWWSDKGYCTISIEFTDICLFLFLSNNGVYRKTLSSRLIPECEVPARDDISQHPRSSKINKTELILICTDIQKLMGKSNDITCANVILKNGELTLTSLQEGEITQKKEKVKFKSTLELNLNHDTVNHLLKLLANSTGDVDILSLANNVSFQTNNGTMKENVPPEVNTLVERYRLEHEDIMPFVLSKAELSQALGQVIIAILRNSNTRLFFILLGQTSYIY